MNNEKLPAVAAANESDPIVFRDLPGIAEIERLYLLYLDNMLMKDEIGDLLQAIDAKSIELFGIVETDTSYWSLPREVNPGSQDEWERHFEFIAKLYDEENDFWDFFGIDVSDDEGEQLVCIFAFGRQLVCALKRLHPDATLAFWRGEQTDDQLQATAEAWGKLLLGKR